MLTAEGFCHVEFHGARPQDAQNWFVGSADIKNASRQMCILGWLQAFFCIVRCSRIRSWLFCKNDLPDTTIQRVVRGRCSFVKMSRTTVRSREVLILLPLFFAVTNHSTDRCLAWDRLASAGRMLTILGFLQAFSIASKGVSHDFDYDHEHDHHTTTRFNPTRQRVGSLPQCHPGLWGTPVGPGRTPTVHQCPEGKAVGGHNLCHDRRPPDRRQALRQTCFQQTGAKTNMRYNNQVLTATWNLTW